MNELINNFFVLTQKGPKVAFFSDERTDGFLEITSRSLIKRLFCFEKSKQMEQHFFSTPNIFFWNLFQVLVIFNIVFWCLLLLLLLRDVMFIRLFYLIFLCCNFLFDIFFFLMLLLFFFFFFFLLFWLQFHFI